ncbi:hypothetical protein Tcan_14697 [Toxocara canis]|uniref:Uncharacterized protein n=1 Tax=Toxocara canis TaxID=6265 RepID=A0A0B2V091_TOXCA|nr:hypothetical protein Tcan_14697 [Toxocara canis]
MRNFFSGRFMRRAFGDDKKVTSGTGRDIKSSCSTQATRQKTSCRGEQPRKVSASHRPSLARNAEERRRRISEIRKRFDSQTSSASSKNKCAEAKRPKPMGGVASSSRSKLLGRRQLREPTESKRTVVLRNETAGDENERDLRRRMHQMREKYDSASEELEANEQELIELREALNVARRGSSVLSAQNMSYVDKVESLTAELEKSRKREIQLRAQIDRLSDLLKREALAERDSTEAKQNDENKENCALQKLGEENERLRGLIGELNNEKGTLDEALRKTKEENDRLTQEIIRLNSTIEVEREEWDHMQADLLVAVRVANDFKMEAQEEMKSLYAKIADLQRRRQSNVANVSIGSIKLFDERQQSWEDVAWQRLMRGCERG